jgi:hypothetical protein
LARQQQLNQFLQGLYKAQINCMRRLATIDSIFEIKFNRRQATQFILCIGNTGVETPA